LVDAQAARDTWQDGAKGTSIWAQRFDRNSHKRLVGTRPDGGRQSETRHQHPDDWISGGDPMTAAQASYLKTLSEEAHRPDAFAPNLTKAEASKRIDALRQLIKTRDR